MNINTSLAKAFFKENDIRSTPEAINKFKELLETAGLSIAKNAAENAKDRNRKTVSVLDFKESLDDEDEEVMEETETEDNEIEEEVEDEE